MDTKEIYKNKIPYEQWTEADHTAIEKKRANPQLKVLCPRCGKELQHEEYATAKEVGVTLKMSKKVRKFIYGY